MARPKARARGGATQNVVLHMASAVDSPRERFVHQFQAVRPGPFEGLTL